MDTTFQDIGAAILANLALILRLLLILALTWLGIALVTSSEKRFLKRLSARSIEPGQQARMKTLLHAGVSILEVVIIGAAVLMIMVNLGIDIGPLLASAGVAGLAISLGAQTLIKDYIGGTLILFENIFQVGEVIEVNGVVGTVERIELRTTQVRDFTGKLITIPNGEIRTLANTSRDWNRAVVDLNLSVEADLSLAVETLQNAVAQAAQDEKLKVVLLETPQIQGWSSLSDWAVQVRITAKTLPGKQIEAATILRKVALEALHDAGINLAIPPLRVAPPGS